MTGSLVRRGRGWIALVFACVVAASATSAGTAGAAGSSSGANSSSEAAKPDLDAEATFAYAIGPANFDPIRPLAFYAYTYEIYDRLTKIDDSLEVQPMLAESWEFSEDGTTLTFHLRDDAKFTDGSKIDAAAVKANIDRARLMPFSTQRTSLSAVSAVDVVDPTTVKLTLVRGQGVQLPSVFAGTAGMIVNPKAIADPTVDLTNGPGKGMESGPWVLESVTLGTSNGEVQYVRRPDWDTYWDKEAGRIKRLKVLGISTSVQRINAVRAGDITMGMITDVDVPAAADLMKSKDVGGITVSLITTVFGLEMKPERQAISNLKLRQAIQLGLDKKAFNEGLYGGYCPVSSQDYPKGNFWHVDALDKRDRYNPAKAKKLVAESGVTNPTLTTLYTPFTQAATEAVRDQLSKIGITVEAAPSTVTGPSFPKGDVDISWTHLLSVDPADTMKLTYMEETPGRTPIIPVADQPEFAALTAKLSDPAATLEQRKKTWAEIATKLYDNAYVVPVCNGSVAFVTDGSIPNLEDMLSEWNAQPDFRYLYRTKT